MRIVSLVVGLTALIPSGVMAQTAAISRGQSYVFIAPGFGNTVPGDGILHFGVGGEALVRHRIGIGAEIGAVGPWPIGPSHQGGFADWVVGLGSANVSYHFLPEGDRKTEPFVTAGYSNFFRAGAYHGYNAGAGMNFWFKPKVATRFEVRYQNSFYREAISFRLGLTFR
jgi:hypothetical protein